MHRNFTRLLASIALAAMCGCTESSTPFGNGTPPPPAATPTPVGLQTPAPGYIYLGGYVPSQAGSIPTLESIMKRKAAMDMHYVAWAALFPHIQEPADLENGRYSVDSWDCGTTDAQIVSGADDPLLISRAQAIKAFGHALFLRFFWDMNVPANTVFPYSNQARTECYDPATDSANNAFSATEFVAAWIHIRKIFAAQGVNNVIWVWDVAAVGANPAAYYPGSSEVDWIGVDTYASAGGDFTSLFSPTYAFLSQYNKPILIAETGTQSLNQPNYFAGIAQSLESTFPLVQGIIYFDAPNGGVNYTIAPPAAGATPGPGAAAFSTMANTPYLTAFGTP